MLDRQAVPILEFDDAREAVIEPQVSGRWSGDVPFPGACVIAFMQESVSALVKSGDATPLLELEIVTGDIPVYHIERDGYDIALLACPVGAPIAANVMENIQALGCKSFISFGGAGVLERDIAVGHILLPVRAIRDEGLSYHYLPPSRFVQGDAAVVDNMVRTLTHLQADFARVTTWTTDAFFRETRDKVALRRAEGCACVDMEVSALMSVAQFRGLRYGALLYGADNLDGEAWDDRNWAKIDKRSWLLELSISCAAGLIEAKLP